MTKPIEVVVTRATPEPLSPIEQGLFDTLKGTIKRFVRGSREDARYKIRGFQLDVEPNSHETGKEAYDRQSLLSLLRGDHKEWGEINRHIKDTCVDVVIISIGDGDSMDIDVRASGRGIRLSVGRDGNPRVYKRDDSYSKEEQVTDSSIATREQRLRFSVFLTQAIEAASKSLPPPFPKS